MKICRILLPPEQKSISIATTLLLKASCTRQGNMKNISRAEEKLTEIVFQRASLKGRISLLEEMFSTVFAELSFHIWYRDGHLALVNPILLDSLFYSTILTWQWQEVRGL
jgi:hypothetical protein